MSDGSLHCLYRDMYQRRRGDVSRKTFKDSFPISFEINSQAPPEELYVVIFPPLMPAMMVKEQP